MGGTILNVWDSPALRTKCEIPVLSCSCQSCSLAIMTAQMSQWSEKLGFGNNWMLPISFCLNFSDSSQSPLEDSLIGRGLGVSRAYKDQLQSLPKWKPWSSLPRILEFSFWPCNSTPYCLLRRPFSLYPSLTLPPCTCPPASCFMKPTGRTPFSQYPPKRYGTAYGLRSPTQDQTTWSEPCLGHFLAVSPQMTRVFEARRGTFPRR